MRALGAARSLSARWTPSRRTPSATAPAPSPSSRPRCLTEPSPIGVYVHWPYCARICPYCDFNVALDRRAGEAEALFEAILQDLHGQAEPAGRHGLVSIFLGGGTPS